MKKLFVLLLILTAGCVSLLPVRRSMDGRTTFAYVSPDIALVRAVVPGLHQTQDVLIAIAVARWVDEPEVQESTGDTAKEYLVTGVERINFSDGGRVLVGVGYEPSSETQLLPNGARFFALDINGHRPVFDTSLKNLRQRTKLTLLEEGQLLDKELFFRQIVDLRPVK